MATGTLTRETHRRPASPSPRTAQLLRAAGLMSGPTRPSGAPGGGAPRPPQPPGLMMIVCLALWDSLSRALHRARSGRRVRTLLVAYIVLTLLMGWRLVEVQIVAADQYSELARRQTQREVALPAPRGSIVDRDGDPLAMSLSAATIFANPTILADEGVSPDEVAAQLAPILGLPAADLAEDLASDRQFVFLARQLPRDIGETIKGLELAGIGVMEEPTRVYPADRIASQVIGWAGVDNSGWAGLELQHDSALAGTPGTLRLETAPGGLEISAAPREVQPAVPGVDLQLTIDREVQFATEEILLDALEEYGAIGGSAVVMDVHTGEVLAMASVPGVAPSGYPDATPYDRRNRALTDVFEPGSVNKVITIAGALEDGLTRPDEVFTVPHRIAIAPEVYHDSEPHATAQWTVGDIMERSSNVGTIMIAQRLGQQRLHDYVTSFGMGVSTGLSFPGESRGLLADPENWNNASLPTIAIGQGVSATLVQVASVFNVIANDGEYLPPSLVRGTVDDRGAFTPADRPAARRVVSPATARTVADMLIDVVESDHGTGQRAAVQGYRVGGKTGTAQKPLEGELGYMEDAYIATFAGFAPVDDPQVVVAVMLDEPTPHYGGLSAAPTFSRIMEFTLRDQRISPEHREVPLPVGHRLANTYAVPAPVADPDADEDLQDDALAADEPAEAHDPVEDDTAQLAPSQQPASGGGAATSPTSPAATAPLGLGTIAALLPAPGR